MTLFYRKSWTWAASTVPLWLSWWDASGARWRASSPDFLPGKSAPCLWVWLTGRWHTDAVRRYCCLWLHLLSENCSVEFQHSSLPLRRQSLLRKQENIIVNQLLIRFLSLIFCFSPVYHATSWSSVQTRWIQWSCKPSVSSDFYKKRTENYHYDFLQSQTNIWFDLIFDFCLQR